MKTIPLLHGKVTAVPADLYDHLITLPWRAIQTRAGKWYVGRNVGGTTEYLHRHIYRLRHIPTPAGVSIVHIDGDGLNNLDDNLRLVAHSHRRTRKSGYKGVTWFKPRQKWKARATVNYKEYHLGYFDDALVAALARDNFIRKMPGPHAVSGVADRRKAS